MTVRASVFLAKWSEYFYVENLSSRLTSNPQPSYSQNVPASRLFRVTLESVLSVSSGEDPLQKAIQY